MRRGLDIAVGVAALVAPALHSLTDAMEWHQHGFGSAQPWVNDLARPSPVSRTSRGTH